MTKNHGIDVSAHRHDLVSVVTSVEQRATMPKRRINPWHWFGWMRKKFKHHSEREFYSHAEKRRHQHVKMAQRLANHHHGFKF